MDKRMIHDSRDSFDPYSLFNGKAKLYKFRAHYSEECISYLCRKYKIDSCSTVADVGGGTGILSKQLHEYSGCRIILVEPNLDMLEEARNNLSSDYAGFIRATAEDSEIESDSIDLVVVGTAFHWFDMDRFREECLRICKSSAGVAILRLYDFVPDIDGKNSSDYHSIDSEINRAAMFFGKNCFSHKLFFHDEVFDEQRFVFERLSDHNAPSEADKDYADYILKAKEAFGYFKSPSVSNVIITACMDGELG